MNKKVKNVDVNDFINDLEHPLKDIIIKLREIILSCNKDITEHIKWNAPSFCYNNDDRITFKLNNKNCVQLVFHTGAKGKDSNTEGPLFEDESNLLAWVADRRALMTFYTVNEVDTKKEEIIKIVNKWLEATINQ